MYTEKACLSDAFPTTNPTRPDLDTNSSRRSGKAASHRLSYSIPYNTSLSFIFPLYIVTYFNTYELSVGKPKEDLSKDGSIIVNVKETQRKL
jgi:hypothetical protein